MSEMNKTRFGRLVVGEKFRLPGSDILMIKETLRQTPERSWVNATYDIIEQTRPCYVHNDTQVVRRRSNEGTELRLSTVKKGFGEVK